MTRLVVKYRIDGEEEFVNIPCGELTERDGMLFAWRSGELCGVFDLGRINIAYLTEMTK